MHEQERLHGERKIEEMTPKLSVIVPTYNRARLLPRAVRSLQRQTYRDIEIIIVDDGSTDDTKYVASTLIFYDERVRYVPLNHSGLPAVVVNVGVARARGNWVGWLSDDDEWAPNLVSEHFNFVSKHPGKYGATYCSTITVEADGSQSERFSSPYEGISGDIAERLMDVCFTPPLIARRRYWHLNTNPAILGVEDWDLCIRIARQTPVGYLPSTHMIKHVSPEGLITKVGTIGRLKATVAMFQNLNEPGHEAAARSQLFWEQQRLKLPFCLRGYRLKWYARQVLKFLRGKI